MFRRNAILALALVASTVVVAPITQVMAAQDAAVRGTNVKMVIYEKNGEAAGTFVQTGPGQWIEHNDDGRFTFRETGRDQWSVYLVKYGRQGGQPVQLDLYRKTVSTGDYVFYRIVKSSR